MTSDPANQTTTSKPDDGAGEGWEQRLVRLVVDAIRAHDSHMKNRRDFHEAELYGVDQNAIPDQVDTYFEMVKKEEEIAESVLDAARKLAAGQPDWCEPCGTPRGQKCWGSCCPPREKTDCSNSGHLRIGCHCDTCETIRNLPACPSCGCRDLDEVDDGDNDGGMIECTACGNQWHGNLLPNAEHTDR